MGLMGFGTEYGGSMEGEIVGWELHMVVASAERSRRLTGDSENRKQLSNNSEAQ